MALLSLDLRLPVNLKLAFLCALLVASASAASVVAPIRGCSTDLDCSLLGVCKNGACVCSAGFTGSSCQLPSLAPFTFSGYVNESSGSWGGNTVLTNDGKVHLFFSEMANDCPLRLFYNVSQFSHAVADDFTGNFTKIGVVRAPEAHNAEVRQAPDGTFLMYGIASEEAYPPVHCEERLPSCCLTPKNCTCGQASRPLAVFSAPTLDGPWTYHPITVTDPTHSLISTNPSVTFLSNGTVMMAFRGNPASGGEITGIATAPHFTGPFTQVATVVSLDDGIGDNEDPFLWVDERGFHCLTHNQGHGSLCDSHSQCAAHFFSEDALTWHFIPEPFYNASVNMADGSVQTFKARQRPKLSFHPDGSPAALWSGGNFEGTGWTDLSVLTHTYYVPFAK